MTTQPTSLAPSLSSVKPPTPRATRGPSPAKTRQTRQTLLNAALAEFVEHGYARATTTSIAERANVAKVTLYRYFRSKEEILECVIDEYVSTATHQMESSQINDGELVGDFILRALLPSFQQIDSSGRSATARLVIVEGLQFPHLAEIYRTKSHQPLIEQIRKLSQLALDRGELKTDTLVRHPELLLAPLWLAMMNNTALNPQAPLNAAELFKSLVTELFGLPPAPRPLN